MAEYCLDCWNRINGTQDKEDIYVISRHLELCEGCGEFKPIIITYRVYRRNKIFFWRHVLFEIARFFNCFTMADYLFTNYNL